MKGIPKNEDPLGTGCVIVALLVFGGGMIIQIIDRLILLLTIGGIGFLMYRVFIYDQRTGAITAWFEKAFNLGPKKDSDDEPLNALPEDTSDVEDHSAILDELSFLRQKLQKMEQDKAASEQRAEQRTAEAVIQAANQASHNTKKQVLNDLYKGESSSINDSYSRSDEFEKQQWQKAQQQKEEELNQKAFELKTESRLMSQDQNILALRTEVRDDIFDVKAQIATLDARLIQQEHQFKEALLKVMQTVMDVKAYLDDKINRLHTHLIEQLSACREMITTLKAEYQQDMANTKLQFGQEVLRLDQQQGRIISKMETYHNDVKALSVQVEKVRLEGQRSRMESRQIFERANTLYQRGELKLQAHSKELELQLKEIAVDKESFANSAGRAKMQLDHHSHSLKMQIREMGYERLGIESVRQDFMSRQQTEQTKNQLIRNDIAHQNQLIQERINKGEAVAALRHQLNMSQERLVSSEQRLGLLRQENAFVRRLHL